LFNRFCFSGVTQNARPFASGLGVCDLGIGSAVNHDAEWLRLDLRSPAPKPKRRPGILERAIEVPPSHDDFENGCQVNVDSIPVVDRPILSPSPVHFSQFGFNAGNWMYNWLRDQRIFQ
jgi:hypothetical protein